MDAHLKPVLDSDPVKNIAVTGFFKNYPIEEYYIENNSAIIFGRSDYFWAHIIASTPNELSSILSKYHSKTKYYFSVEDWMIPQILDYGSEDWIMATNRYILDENVVIRTSNSEVVKIDKSYASYIHENSDYKDFTSVEYTKERLMKDISAGIFMDHKLVAWGFTHDDGALGFLHVLKDFRNKGYGLDILSSLVQMKREENKPVFGNIVPENNPSIKLAEKLGFKFDRRVSWLKLK